MRVLHLVGQAEDNGGILSVIRGLQEATAQLGVEHLVWVREGYRETRKPKLDYRFTRHLVSDAPSHGTLLAGAVRAWSELRALRGRESFDLLHAHSRGGFLVALLTALLGRERVVFTNHSFARKTWMYRFAARRSNFHCVVLTPSMGKHYGLEAETSSGRVRVIPACYDDRFLELPLRKGGKEGGGPVRLVGIGNIVRWKNWHLLLKAMALLSERERALLEFEHWGPVPTDDDSPRYAEELKRQVKDLRLGSGVVWKGATGDVAGCLGRADWFVLPSTDEPCSVALMESLAAGVPVMASASGGSVDLVRHGETGVLFEPENAIDLAGHLGRIARGELRMKPAGLLRDSVLEKRASVVGAAYRKLYLEVCGGGGA